MSDLVNNVTEKAMEATKPVVKEVVTVPYSLGKKAGIFVGGLVTGVGLTKLFEKIGKKKTGDKKHFWTNKKVDVVDVDFQEVTEETEENQEAPTE